ncbi:hypothetical protein PIB30_050853 [Stylosanthes scabra]|uniref:Uncharacterized protein n=1 Tax=Stylosanthes scabra TaxID=79078 RepID=A0ABU6ZGK1_9FABA|nr:hypothetical protein [Stylosanthes scabra]
MANPSGDGEGFVGPIHHRGKIKKKFRKVSNQASDGLGIGSSSRNVVAPVLAMAASPTFAAPTVSAALFYTQVGGNVVSGFVEAKHGFGGHVSQDRSGPVE